MDFGLRDEKDTGFLNLKRGTMKLLITTIIMMLSANVFAEEIILPAHLTWEKVDKKCNSWSQEKREANKVCKESDRRLKEKDVLDSYPFVSFRMHSDLTFSVLEGRDIQNGGTFSLASEYGIKLMPIFAQHISPSFKTYQALTMEYIEFDNSIVRPLINPRTDLYTFTLGLIYNPWRTGSLDFNVSYGENYYLRSKTLNTLTIDKYLVPTIQLKFSQDVISFGGVDVGFAGKYAISTGFRASNREEASGNYDVYQNDSKGLEIYARKAFKHWTIMGALGYEFNQKNTSIMDGDITQTVFGFRIAVPFGFNDGGK